MNFRRRTSLRLGLIIGTSTALIGLAAWAAVHWGLRDDPSLQSGSASAAGAPGLAAESSEAGAAPAGGTNGGGDAFDIAQAYRRRGPTVRGDDSALAAFKTTLAQGALTAIPTSGDPLRGSFSPVVSWPLVGIHTVLTPDGRVLTYGTNANGTQSGYYIYDVWNPQLGLGMESHTILSNTTAVDIFCNAQLLLPSGDIELYGGDVTDLASTWSLNQPNDDSDVFRPLDNDRLVYAGKMNRKRWYATATTLPNGEVYIQGGNGGNDFPEVRTNAGTFRLLTGAPTNGIAAKYPRNFVGPDGKIFGMSKAVMYRIDPGNAGTRVTLGTFPTSNNGGSSTSVMFRPNRILQVGGGDTASASLEASVIDISNATPVVTALPQPTYRRHWGNATVLADGRVLVSGGSTANNNPDNGVAYTSEIYDPATNTWSPGATARQMRLYHSGTLLLTDATVLTLGGGALLGGNPGPQLNLNAELYYPPYLFNADGTAAARPIISSAPMTVEPSQKIRIGTPAPGAITRVTLVKAGSVTHSFDMDQRFIELPFTVVGSELEASLPTNAYQTPPGFYMVFVINDKGVPSEAAMLRINVQAPASSATLTINKIVVNNDGGTKAASDFSFSVNGAAPVAFEADGGNVLSVPAGTYTVTEPATAGYAASLSGCSGIVLAAGGSATCSITNDDPAPQLATLTVNKVVVNNDGGTKVASDFSFSVNGAAPVAFEADGSNVLSLPAGTYTVTEPLTAGYAASLSGCSSIVLAAGGSATCTITNNDPAPQPAMLTVSKVVVNDNGGTKVASDFSFSVNGATPVAFEADGSNVLSVPAGTYTVTEPATAGYAASLPGCSGIVLAAGGSATCTITNNDPATQVATLTINKIVVNNDGGTKLASNFSFSVNGAAPVAFEADGSNVISVPAGKYTVTEPAVAGYAASLSGCKGIVLAAGGSATCTITNDDQANLIVNGNFETNSVPNGSAQLVANLTGWRNTAGAIEVWRNYSGYTPGSTASYIELDGSGVVSNQVYQDIPTLAGATYDLSFLQSPRPGNSASSNSFDVYWNNTKLATISRSGDTLLNTSWQTTQLVVTGSGADRLWFREYDSDDRGALIDKVRLVRR